MTHNLPPVDEPRKRINDAYLAELLAIEPTSGTYEMSVIQVTLGDLAHDLAADLQDARIQLAAKDKEISGLRDELQTREDEAEAFEETVAAKDARVIELEARVKELEAENARLRDQSGYGCLAMPIIVDPALPPDTIIFKDQHGNELGRINNVGNHFEASADPVEIMQLATGSTVRGEHMVTRAQMLRAIRALEAAGFRIIGPEPTLKMLLAAIGQPHNVVFQKIHAAAPVYGTPSGGKDNG